MIFYKSYSSESRLSPSNPGA